MEVCREAGISYRRLDYWTCLGLFDDVDVPNPGSGRGRTWSEQDARVAVAIRMLTASGVSMQAISKAIREGTFPVLLSALRIAVEDARERVKLPA